MSSSPCKIPLEAASLSMCALLPPQPQHRLALIEMQYCLNKPPANWNGGVGFVSKEMIEKHMPSGGIGSATHGEGEKVLMCGPPPMMTAMK